MVRLFISLMLIILMIDCNAVGIEVKPGGPYPTIQAGVNMARAGDTVLVRAGVYRESVVIRTSGDLVNPLVIMAYPGEKVVLDGSEILQNWTRCASADQVSGNPNWKNIFYSDVPDHVNRININLFHGDSLMTIAQLPEAKDPFYDENTGEWYLTPAQPGAYDYSGIVDESNISLRYKGKLEGSYVKIVAGNNEVYIRKIIEHSPEQYKINFESLPASIRLIPGRNRYAISNHPLLLDKPGKYYLNEKTNRVYIWPYEEGTLHSSVTATIRDKAFLFSNIKHVIIDGFVIRKYYGRNISGNESDSVIIRKCTIEKGIIENDGGIGPSIYMIACNYCTIENCTIRDNKHSRGIIFNRGTYNTVKSCTLRRTGGTAVDFYRERNSRLLYNNLRDCNGQHANGLTCYLGCRNILIQGNIVINCNTGLTYQQIDSMMVVNNIFHGGDRSSPTACWNASNSSHITFIHNTLIGSGSRHEAIHTQNGNIKNLVVRNNILDGMSGKEGANVSHNLYISQSGNQHPLSEGDIILHVEPDQLFMDPAHDNYKLKAGAAAFNAGLKSEITNDLYGNPRPYGKRPDIGHHEWRPEKKR